MRGIKLLGVTAALVLIIVTGALQAQDFDSDDDPDHDPAPHKAKPATDRGKSAEDKKFRDFNEVIKGSEKIDGFFTLHRKDEHLYAEIRRRLAQRPDRRLSRHWGAVLHVAQRA